MIIDHDHVIIVTVDVTSLTSYTTCMANDLFNMRLPEEYLRWLDELRREEADIPTRSEMARRCIAIVAEQRGKTGKGKRK